MSKTAAPLPVHVYRAAANLIAPWVYPKIAARLERQGTSPARLPERMGHATQPRPYGPLVWFHAASVGESLSVLSLIETLGKAHPETGFLITSGTATSAEILSDRLPPRTQHQFAPLDSRYAVDRFLAHWAPNAVVFVESELWPQMLSRTHTLGSPMALINARLSDRSARTWGRFGRTARFLMSYFEMIHCQDERTAQNLRGFGATQAKAGVNLKSLAGPLPFDTETLTKLQEAVGARFVWLAASTHPGEDKVVLDAHSALMKQDTEALMILVPRHPERSDDIQALCAARGLQTARRSAGAMPNAATQVYLADTLGEMGLWYTLSPLTCLCGSFSDVGGHNPYEPAHAGSALLHGPHYANFAPTYADLARADGALQVETSAQLGQALCDMKADPQALTDLRARTRSFASAQDDVLDGFAQTLSKALRLG